MNVFECYKDRFDTVNLVDCITLVAAKDGFYSWRDRGV